MPTGNYSLIARAIDDDGAGTNSGAVAIEVTPPPPASDGTGTGLSAQYFDNPDLAGTSALARVDAQIDFGWGTGSPGASLAEDDFSVRWTGELEPRYSQTYTLSTVSDDGVRLWLDGQLLIDNWSEHASTEDAVSVPLQAGRRHVVKLEYFELAGAATARFLWSSASQPRQVVPKSQLYPATAAPPPPPSNTPPTVSLTGPAAGASYSAPATVSFAASAADTDGSVNRVEFFANGTLEGTDSSAPYTHSWGNVPAGSYSLTARAVDDDGAATVSQPVSIGVTGRTAAAGWWRLRVVVCGAGWIRRESVFAGCSVREFRSRVSRRLTGCRRAGGRGHVPGSDDEGGRGSGWAECGVPASGGCCASCLVGCRLRTVGGLCHRAEHGDDV